METAQKQIKVNKEEVLQSEEIFQTDRVLTISAGHTVHDTFSGFLPPMLPVLIESLSLTNSQAGLLTVFLQAPFIDPTLDWTNRGSDQPAGCGFSCSGCHSDSDESAGSGEFLYLDYLAVAYGGNQFLIFSRCGSGDCWKIVR